MWIQTTKPEFIYKYCPAPRAAQILNDLTFFLAPASSLNDLFEFRARSLYQEDVESKFRVYSKRLIAEGRFTDFYEALAASRSMDAAAIDETYTAFLEQLHSMCERTMANSGVTCFTSERNNQRMWGGKYGAEHSGAVLEFTTDESRSTFAAHLMPTIYTDTKLPICPSELITEQLAVNQWMLGIFFCTKHVQWKDEREWRLLLLADSPQSQQDRIIQFERTALTRVFLGPKISAKHEQEVRSAASKHHPAIPVFKRKIDGALAQEQPVGIEEVRTFDQIEYWWQRMRRTDVG